MKNFRRRSFFLWRGCGGVSKRTRIISSPIFSIWHHGTTYSSPFENRQEKLHCPGTTIATSLPVLISSSTSLTYPILAPSQTLITSLHCKSAILVLIKNSPSACLYSMYMQPQGEFCVKICGKEPGLFLIRHSAGKSTGNHPDHVLPFPKFPVQATSLRGNDRAWPIQNHDQAQSLHVFHAENPSRTSRHP